MSGLRSFLSKPGNQAIALLVVTFASYFFFARPIEYAQDIEVVGNLAYLATGLDGMRVLDVSDPENPTEVGYFDSPGDVKSVFIQGERAYLASGRAGLVIVDIRDPRNMLQLGAFNSDGFAQDVVVVDQRAFVSDGRSGVIVLNVKNPNKILDMPEAHLKVRSGKLQREGSLIYFVHNGTGIQAAEMSNLSEPKLFPAYNTNSTIHDLAVQNRFVFLATDRGLVVMDFSNPESPVEVSNYQLKGGLTGIFIQGQIGYAVDGTGLRVLDFSHAPAIHEIGSKSTPGAANAIFVRDSFAYIADGFNGAVVFGTRVLVSPDETTIRYSSAQIKTEGVTKAGNHLFLAASEQGVRVLDVTDPAKPRFVKSIDTPGYSRQVTVVADRAFVSDGPSGMLTLDISQLSDTSVSDTTVSIGDDSYATVFANELVYLADGSTGVKIVGFPQPLSPTLISQTPIPGLAQDLALYGDTLFVAAGQGGVWAVSTSNVNFPNLLGNFKASQGEALGIAVLAVNENPSPQPEFDPDQATPGNQIFKLYALVAYGNAGLQIVDVTNPLSLQLVGSYKMDGSIEDVWVGEGYAYLANSNGFIHVVDISNPAQPKLFGIHRTPGQARDLTLDTATLYVADFERGVRILSVADAQKPVEIGFYDAPAFVSFVTTPPQGDHAFILDGRQGMWAIDTTAQADLTEIGSFTTSGIAHSATLADSFLYLADGPAGFQIVNVEDARNPYLVSKFDTPGEAMDLVVDQRILYVADGPRGLRIYDQSNLMEVKEISSFQIPGSARRLALQDDYIYIASMQGGLAILKVTDPNQPARVSIYEALRDVRDVSVRGNYAFLAAGLDGFRVLDISHPLQPQEVFVNFAAAPAEDILLLDHYAFIASGVQGVRIFDISDPERPVEAGLFTQALNALSLAVYWRDDVSTQGTSGYYRIHIADAENRLAVLEANKSLVITRSGIYQTPGTADLSQIAQYLLGGFTRKSDPAMEKAQRTIQQVRFDIVVLGLIGFLIWTAILSQYVLPIQGGKDRLQIFTRLLLFLSGKHGMAIQVKEGRSIQHPDEEFRRGPGVILIDSSSAAILERRVLPYGLMMHLLLRFVYFIIGYIRRLFKQEKTEQPIPHYRVLGPGLHFTQAADFPKLPKWDEKLHAVADLRPQVRGRADVQGYTSEGIELNTSVSVIFSVGQVPEVLYVTYQGDEIPENLRVVEIEEKPVNGAETSDNRPRIVPVVKALNDSLDPEDKQEIHLFLRRRTLSVSDTDDHEFEDHDPAIPFVYNQNRIFAALISRAHDVEAGDFMDWTELPGEVATEVFRNLLATYQYDDLFRPEDPIAFRLNELRSQLNTRMRNLGVLAFQFVRRQDGLEIDVGQVWNADELMMSPKRIFRTPKILRRRGIKVLSAGFGELKPDHNLVREKLFDFWSSRWQQNTELIRADYGLQAVRIRDKARIDAQRDMASLLSRILTDAPEEALALRVFQALENAAADPVTRQFLPADTINMLRNLYQVFIPWEPPQPGNGLSGRLNPGDPTNPKPENQ